MIDAFLAVASNSKAADPNIIVPSIIAAIPLTLGAIGGLILTLHSVRKNRQATERVHDEIRTNHGMRAGEYIEKIGPLVEWAEAHQQQDNEIRVALGLSPGEVPKWDN